MFSVRMDKVMISSGINYSFLEYQGQSIMKNYLQNIITVRINQGDRTWQAFGGGENGHETFRHARIYNFRDKCVVFARNLKFSNLTQ